MNWLRDFYPSRYAVAQIQWRKVQDKDTLREVVGHVEGEEADSRRAKVKSDQIWLKEIKSSHSLRGQSESGHY